ncbi:MAG: ADP-ribosylglycohydrolase family protein [bacterium]
MLGVRTHNNSLLDRARGCLLGQLAGDALGSLVEFQSPEEIRHSYPDGLRNLADGGTSNTIAGQTTDDAKIASPITQMLVIIGTNYLDVARDALELVE